MLNGVFNLFIMNSFDHWTLNVRGQLQLKFHDFFYDVASLPSLTAQNIYFFSTLHAI